MVETTRSLNLCKTTDSPHSTRSMYIEQRTEELAVPALP